MGGPWTRHSKHPQHPALLPYPVLGVGVRLHSRQHCTSFLPCRLSSPAHVSCCLTPAVWAPVSRPVLPPCLTHNGIPRLPPPYPPLFPPPFPLFPLDPRAFIKADFLPPLSILFISHSIFSIIYQTPSSSLHLYIQLHQSSFLATNPITI